MSTINSFESFKEPSILISEESENNCIQTIISKDIINKIEGANPINNKSPQNSNSQIFNGRKRKGRRATSSNENRRKKVHDKLELYNIKRKILSHYFKFISDFINKIIIFLLDEKKKKNKKKIQFSNIRYKFVDDGLGKSIFESLKEKTIEELLFEYSDTKKNVEVYNYVTGKSNIIKKILKEKCFNDGFLNKFYKNQKDFNFIKYDLDLDVTIKFNSKIKSFEDLLKCNFSDNEKENEIYKKKLEECIQKFFFDTYFKI